MHCLGDYAEFARRKGSKDRKPRKKRLMGPPKTYGQAVRRDALTGAGVGAAANGVIGAGLNLATGGGVKRTLTGAGLSAAYGAGSGVLWGTGIGALRHRKLYRKNRAKR